MLSPFIIRPFHEDDSLERITEVIHKGYSVLAVNGLRFWGTHQSVEDTLERLNKGAGFVAVLDDEIVGTVTIRPPDPDSEVELYRDSTTWILNQFAVVPDVAGRGIGRALHNKALDHARENEAHRIALDTADTATALIAMYKRWGYEIVGACDWRPFTNYTSVVMALQLP
ncbi:MAG: GNAT family N-acetyltransferase [Candidatus Kapabacteria bacterium]|nr:GNAT family N-acetyltransferase [Candidatus Kapabacteria bacterium]